MPLHVAAENDEECVRVRDAALSDLQPGRMILLPLEAGTHGRVAMFVFDDNTFVFATRASG